MDTELAELQADLDEDSLEDWEDMVVGMVEDGEGEAMEEGGEVALEADGEEEAMEDSAEATEEDSGNTMPKCRKAKFNDV